MQSNPWASFWRTLTRFETEKIRPRIAIRNTVGVMLPLVLGGISGQTSLGLVGALGALNVAYSDGEDAYRERARRMTLASFVVALALAVGGLTGRHNPLAVMVAAAWAFVAGLLVALGTTAGDLGTISLVTLVVFASRPLTPQQAFLSGFVALGAALCQTGLSLVFWPVRRYRRERHILSDIYRELSRLSNTELKSGTAPLASATFTVAHQSFAYPDRSTEFERLTSLLSQAERIRLRLLTLSRIRRRLLREENKPELVILMDEFATECSQVLFDVSETLASRDPGAKPSLDKAADLLECLRRHPWPGSSTFFLALTRDAVSVMDAVLGQIRTAVRLTDRLSAPAPAPSRMRPANRSRAQFQTQVSILKANLSTRSVAFRHALRLAVCVAVGEMIGRGFDWQRSYWIPMTIAIVLKPDFMSTFTRGAFRVAGTFVGLIFATIIYHLFPASPWTDVIFVGAFTLALRWIGPANYGVFVIAVSGLVVALIANTGIAPKQVIPLRAMNTAIGGALALLAYALWPTWERTQSGESFARLLEAYRAYLRGIQEAFAHPDTLNWEMLDRLRQAARVARSNAEASAERIRMEPGTTPELASAVTAMLATSHEFIYAVMTLEGTTAEQVGPQEGVRKFLDQVELTLYFLAAAIRGSRVDLKSLPDLREQYRTLIEVPVGAAGRHSLIAIETDHMVTALNTCTEQVLGWLKRERLGPGARLEADNLKSAI